MKESAVTYSFVLPFAMFTSRLTTVSGKSWHSWGKDPGKILKAFWSCPHSLKSGCGLHPSGGWDAPTAWWDLTGFTIDKPPAHHTNVEDKRSELQSTKRRQLAEKSAWSITQREPRQTLIRLSTHTCQNNNHKKKCTWSQRTTRFV